MGIIRKNWDLRPGVIGKLKVYVATLIYSHTLPVRELNLQKPQYLKTASYGHFGD